MISAPAQSVSVKAAVFVLTVSCMDAASFCRKVSYTLNGNATIAPVVLNATGVCDVALGPFQHGDTPSVVITAVDVAGNAAAPFARSLMVDLNFPVTIWTNVPVFWLMESTAQLHFLCSKSDCAVKYRLDDSLFRNVSVTNTASTSTTTASLLIAAVTVDTLVITAPPLLTVSSTASFQFNVWNTGVAALPDWVVLFIEVSIDGGAWTDMRYLPGFVSASSMLVLLAFLLERTRSLLVQQ